MGYSGFSKLPSDGDVLEGNNAAATATPATAMPQQHNSRRTRPFTPFEIGLITTLILFAAALATYTIIYVVQHGGAIRPAAVAALSCVAVLLLAVACSVYTRIRRPNWFRDDVEAGEPEDKAEKKWKISAPIPMSQADINISQMTVGSEGTTSTTTTTTTYATLSSKGGRLQKKKKNGREGLDSQDSGPKHRLMLFWGSPKSNKADLESEHLISSGRSSAELSEGGNYQAPPNENRPLSLWKSVFELVGEGSLDPSTTSRPTTPELPASSDGAVQIVVTRPEPTAPRQSALLRGRAAQSPSAGSIIRKSSPLGRADPLRSNPFQQQQQQLLQRDPSVRQTRSSHALGSVPARYSHSTSFLGGRDDLVLVDKQEGSQPPPRRPRSAEPGPDRARLGYDLATIQLQIDRAVADMETQQQSSRQRTGGGLKPLLLLQPQRISLSLPPALPTTSCNRSRSESRSRSRQDDRRAREQRPSQSQSPSPSRALRRARSPLVAMNPAEDDTTGHAQDLRKAYQVGK